MTAKRPSDTAFRQQRLSAWRPILTPRHFILTIVLVGLLFIPIGVLLVSTAAKCREVHLDYTDFIGVGSPNEKERTVHAPVLDYQLVPEKTTVGGSRTFRITFKLEAPLEAPFYMYYQLENYHQNYRKYVASVNRRQLYGEKLGASQVAKSCFPIISPGAQFKRTPGSLGNRTLIPEEFPVYYPCGLIANTIFPDMLSLEILNSDTGNLAVRMSCDDLTLQIDRENYKRTAYSIDDIRMPPSWSFDHFQDKCSPNGSDERTLKRSEIPNADKKYTIFPDISESQGHLYGWMRTSMFPRFRKLYAKSLQTSLLPGTYTIIIQSNLEAHKMMARKTIVLANASSFGGRSYFLGIIYLVLGSLLLIAGIIFLALNAIRPVRNTRQSHEQLFHHFPLQTKTNLLNPTASTSNVSSPLLFSSS